MASTVAAGFGSWSTCACPRAAPPFTALRDDVLIARHALDAIALDALQYGGLAGRLGNAQVTVGPGDCVLMDLRDTMHILGSHRDDPEMAN